MLVFVALTVPQLSLILGRPDVYTTTRQRTARLKTIGRNELEAFKKIEKAEDLEALAGSGLLWYVPMAGGPKRQYVRREEPHALEQLQALGWTFFIIIEAD